MSAPMTSKVLIRAAELVEQGHCKFSMAQDAEGRRVGSLVDELRNIGL